METSRQRFPLSSEQCELLLAFEAAESLSGLASQLARDVSVVSRQLKQLAEDAPVLEKRKGRWWLTDLGRQVNQWTRSALAVQRGLLDQHARSLSPRRLASLRENPCLMLVGVQRGFDDPAWGARNNPDAEKNIATLLSAWRSAKLPILHVRHLSKDPASPIRAGALGSDFRPVGIPIGSERVFDKSTNSGFTGTELQEYLQATGLGTLVIVGFSLNHCVDATARSAADLGFSTFVVSDATVCFDRVGPNGERLKADDLQAGILANLSQEFATILSTRECVSELREPRSLAEG